MYLWGDDMNKVAVITGGTRGIGRATVEAFAKKGYSVAFCYENSEKEAKIILSEHPDMLALKCDVSNGSEVENFFDRVLKNFGRIDCLVANAGIAQTALFTDITERQFDRVCNVNLKGTFLTLKYGAKQMIKQKSGSIVTVSSMWGQVGGSCEAVYSATKAAVIGLTKALAKELGPSGIRVNCVCPGVIDTEMNSNLTADDLKAISDETPLCRIGKPEEVANVITFLCDEQSSFVTGQTVSVGGGIVI